MQSLPLWKNVSQAVAPDIISANTDSPMLIQSSILCPPSAYTGGSPCSFKNILRPFTTSAMLSVSAYCIAAPAGLQNVVDSISN